MIDHMKENKDRSYSFRFLFFFTAQALSFHLRERFLKRERINRRLGPKAIRSLKNTLS